MPGGRFIGLKTYCEDNFQGFQGQREFIDVADACSGSSVCESQRLRK